MKIFKYIGSILFDVGKVILGIGIGVLVIGIVALLAVGILCVICGTSAFVSKLFGGNMYVLCGCCILWLIGLFSWSEGINPIKGTKETIIDIKNYFVDKWNEIK